MKKILSIAALMIYLFSINTLVHASTMGIFGHTTHEVGSCHAHQQTSKNTSPNLNCCEFAFSNEYSNTQIQWEQINFLPNIIPHFDLLAKDPYIPNIYTMAVVWSPGRNPDIKYDKFSDLFGIIVSLS